MKQHDHDELGGLERDLAALARFRPNRRSMLGWLAGASVIPIIGCDERPLSLATDNIFSDGSSLQIPSITGDVTNGIAATLRVGIAI